MLHAPRGVMQQLALRALEKGSGSASRPARTSPSPPWGLANDDVVAAAAAPRPQKT